MSWNPAASVPCAFTQAGLPVGLQIVGKRFEVVPASLGSIRTATAVDGQAPAALARFTVAMPVRRASTAPPKQREMEHENFTT
ncbi:hypothetical protein [Bradyrhizobium elkanii]